MGDVLNFKYNCVPMSIFAPAPPLPASNTYEIMCMQLATKGLDSAEHNRHHRYVQFVEDLIIWTVNLKI